MSKTTHRSLFRGIPFLWIIITAGLLVIFTTGIALAFTQSSQVSFTLEGCRFTDGLTLPLGGKYICPDANYTTGNLQKGWNELDLVPHRLTTQSGNQSGATTDYSVYIAADNQTGGKTGYDVISEPVVNAAKSDASCSVTPGGQLTSGSAADPFGGGTDVVIYRELTIHQNKGTTCVFDYYQRLALGAHLYPGSSLQSYMFDQVGLSGSKKTVSIPVTAIQPQSINKDMSATEGGDYAWGVTKTPNPATLTFDNTCDSGNPKYQGVEITINWEKHAAVLGKITAITHVYAKNPSAREITVNVTDKIYAGTTATGSVLDQMSSGAVDVPANTADFLILTHTALLDAGPTALNDVATATYTDKVTGLAVPGTTTASAGADVQLTYTNASATINDVESITGSWLSYSADSFLPLVGAFDGGYVAGTKTTGNVSWTSDPQTGAGSVTFDKTVYVSGAYQTSGTLHDIATLTGSDGFSDDTTADIQINASALVSLVINKNITPAQLTDQTFTFKVKDSLLNDVATVDVTVPAGSTSGSTTVTDLAPGAYTVSEVAKAGWITDSDKSATITLPACSGSVTFNNTKLGSLKVTKTVNWNGVTPVTGQTFEICITGPSYPGGNCKTIGYNGGDLTWDNLIPGSYTVTETNPGTSWTMNVSGSPAAVPAGGQATAAVTNTRKLGSLKVTKTVDWNGVTADASQIFTICIKGPSYPLGTEAGACKTIGSSGGDLVWNNLIPGAYTISENPGDSWTVDITGSPATVPEDGGQVTAGVTNTRKLGSLQVTKTVNWNGVTPINGQTFTICLKGPSYPVGNEPGACKTFTYPGTLVQTWTGLIPGDYTVSEQDPGSAWTVVEPAGDVTVPTNGGKATAEVTNTRKLGSLKVTKTVNWNGITPDTNKTFEICIKGPSYPLGTEAGACQTIGSSGGDLIWNNLIPGSYEVKEADPGVAWTVNITGSPATVPDNGGQVTAGVTNTRKLGSLEVTKTLDWKGVTPDSTVSFQICITGPSYPLGTEAGACKTFNASNGWTQTWDNLIPGSYTVAETDPGASWDVEITGSPATVPEDGGKATVCVKNTFIPGYAKVLKTMSGAVPPAGQTFTFQLRKDASTSAVGTVLEEKVTDLDGNITFDTPLVPGQTYQLCEMVFAGWTTNLPDPFVPGSTSFVLPNIDNLVVCTNFTVTAGEVKTIGVNNDPPPGGRALTIGFWKNWASCAQSNGKGHKPVLDQTLALYGSGGMVVSAGSGTYPGFGGTFYLVLHGNAGTPDVAPDCLNAVRLLNKSSIDTAKKLASNPAFNMAAQLVAVELNLAAGADPGGIALYVNQAVLLLGKYQFDGTEAWAKATKISAADAAAMLDLARKLDNYNNNRPLSYMMYGPVSSDYALFLPLSLNAR